MYSPLNEPIFDGSGSRLRWLAVHATYSTKCLYIFEKDTEDTQLQYDLERDPLLTKEMSSDQTICQPQVLATPLTPRSRQCAGQSLGPWKQTNRHHGSWRRMNDCGCAIQRVQSHFFPNLT